MKIKAISVNALGKYKIHVSFNDGTDGILDLASLSGKGVFISWDVDDNFNKVFISEDSGVISWPEEIDIDVYNAYFQINNINPSDYFQSEKKYAQYQ